MIVIPMAGLSSRFTQAGYDRPKFMLDLKGRTLFDHSVSSFEHFFHSEAFLFILRDEPGWAEFVREAAVRLGIERYSLAVLSHPTAGQAETVELGLRQAGVGADEPITIFNIDTFRPNFRYPARDWMAEADGYLEVMPGQSDRGYSYVRPDPAFSDQRVIETAEKIVISDLASTGLYWFRRNSDFLQAFSDRSSALAHGELYVAPIYNKLIKSGLRIHYEIIPSSHVIFCGTPSQYQALQKS